MADLEVVLPGDIIDTTPSTENDPMDTDDNDSTVLKLGPGLLQDLTTQQIRATTAGSLHHNDDRTQFWVVTNKRRYVPSAGEPVIGVILNRHAEGYQVDIGSAHNALLPLLAFEGATKRNKPNLVPGTIVYARVVVANSMMDPEIECYNSNTGKSEGYGELSGGFMVKCSLGLARRLLDAEAPVLKEIGGRVPFEAAVGINGRVWVDAGSPRETVLVVNAIRNSEFLDPKQCKAMVRELLER